MLTKCANPECAAPFLYLTRGKLFRLETGVGPAQGGQDLCEAKNPTRKLEYFWLCEECSQSLTLSFDRAAGISIRRLLNARAAAAL
jgi:hypothetical protein